MRPQQWMLATAVGALLLWAPAMPRAQLVGGTPIDEAEANGYLVQDVLKLIEEEERLPHRHHMSLPTDFKCPDKLAEYFDDVRVECAPMAPPDQFCNFCMTRFSSYVYNGMGLDGKSSEDISAIKDCENAALEYLGQDLKLDLVYQELMGMALEVRLRTSPECTTREVQDKMVEQFTRFNGDPQFDVKDSGAEPDNWVCPGYTQLINDVQGLGKLCGLPNPADLFCDTCYDVVIRHAIKATFGDQRYMGVCMRVAYQAVQNYIQPKDYLWTYVQHCQGRAPFRTRNHQTGQHTQENDFGACAGDSYHGQAVPLWEDIKEDPGVLQMCGEAPAGTWEDAHAHKEFFVPCIRSLLPYAIRSGSRFVCDGFCNDSWDNKPSLTCWMDLYWVMLYNNLINIKQHAILVGATSDLFHYKDPFGKKMLAKDYEMVFNENMNKDAIIKAVTNPALMMTLCFLEISWKYDMPYPMSVSIMVDIRRGMDKLAAGLDKSEEERFIQIDDFRRFWEDTSYSDTDNAGVCMEYIVWFDGINHESPESGMDTTKAEEYIRRLEEEPEAYFEPRVYNSQGRPRSGWWEYGRVKLVAWEYWLPPPSPPESPISPPSPPQSPPASPPSPPPLPSPPAPPDSPSPPPSPPSPPSPPPPCPPPPAPPPSPDAPFPPGPSPPPFPPRAPKRKYHDPEQKAEVQDPEYDYDYIYIDDTDPEWVAQGARLDGSYVARLLISLAALAVIFNRL